MGRWMRWYCPPDTGFEIWALIVWSRARYLSVTEAPHNIESSRVSGKETFCFLKLEGQCGVRARDLRLPKQAALTTAPGPWLTPPPYIVDMSVFTGRPVTYCRSGDIREVLSQGERTKFDRFVDMNVRGAQRRVYSDLRIHSNWVLSST